MNLEYSIKIPFQNAFLFPGSRYNVCSALLGIHSSYLLWSDDIECPQLSAYKQICPWFTCPTAHKCFQNLYSICQHVNSKLLKEIFPHLIDDNLPKATSWKLPNWNEWSIKKGWCTWKLHPKFSFLHFQYFMLMEYSKERS